MALLRKLNQRPNTARPSKKLVSPCRIACALFILAAAAIVGSNENVIGLRREADISLRAAHMRTPLCM